MLVQPWLEDYNGLKRGSGCGSVGRVVTSDSTGPRFESSHRQKIIYTLNICYCQLCIEKRKIKKKEAGNSPFLQWIKTILERQLEKLLSRKLHRKEKEEK